MHLCRAYFVPIGHMSQALLKSKSASKLQWSGHAKTSMRGSRWNTWCCVGQCMFQPKDSDGHATQCKHRTSCNEKLLEAEESGMSCKTKVCYALILVLLLILSLLHRHPAPRIKTCSHRSIYLRRKQVGLRFTLIDPWWGSGHNTSLLSWNCLDWEMTVLFQGQWCSPLWVGKDLRTEMLIEWGTIPTLARWRNLLAAKSLQKQLQSDQEWKGKWGL
jgi:hypothetical protein